MMRSSFPSLSDRIQSTFIDTLILVVAMFGCASLLDRMENPPDWIRISMFVAIWVIYEPICTMLGATVGNIVKGIRVRRYKDSTKKVNFIQAFVRYLLKALLGWISFITIGSNPERRALHDLAAGSIMVKA